MASISSREVPGEVPAEKKEVPEKSKKKFRKNPKEVPEMCKRSSGFLSTPASRTQKNVPEKFREMFWNFFQSQLRYRNHKKTTHMRNIPELLGNVFLRPRCRSRQKSGTSLAHFRNFFWTFPELLFGFFRNFFFVGRNFSGNFSGTKSTPKLDPIQDPKSRCYSRAGLSATANGPVRRLSRSSQRRPVLSEMVRK